MNNSDFKQTAEKYKSEMMKLYNVNPAPKKTSEIQPPPPLPTDVKPIENTSPQNENQPLLQSTPEEQTSQNANADMPIETRFPPPVIPEFIIKPPLPNDNNSFGYLKVNVKTGNGGRPIKDSIVTVSEIKDGREEIIRLLSTDESGATETIKLPAPPNSKGNSPQDYESFAKYNISAFSKGFFRETSVDAPIFAGITSVQTFFLIPEPFDYNSGEQTIVDRNPEPVI